MTGTEQDEPRVETRDRKPDEVQPSRPPEPKVLIRAVGIKERNRVRIGRKELEL